MLKQGWMLKSQDFGQFSELWISGLTWCCLLANYTALVCFRLTVSLCWATRRRPHNDQDWVGKDWNQEAGVLTLSSLTSNAKTQQELNLRRHELIGFQHLPWKRYNRIRKQISSEVTPHRLAKWARQLNGSQAGTAKRTKMATYLGTTLSRHLLQTSRWLWDQDCWLVGAAIVLPEEACQVVQEKAEEIGVKVIIVVLRIIIHQLAGKDFCEVKMDTPRHPSRKSAFQVLWRIERIET